MPAEGEPCVFEVKMDPPEASHLVFIVQQPLVGSLGPQCALAGSQPHPYHL